VWLNSCHREENDFPAKHVISYEEFCALKLSKFEVMAQWSSDWLIVEVKLCMERIILFKK
jgi:hypothetical protein